MKRILFLITHPRTSEKIVTVIPELAKHYELEMFNIGQFSLNTPWYGDKDPRVTFHEKYDKYFVNKVNGPEFKNGDNGKCFEENFSVSDFNGVIFDDNRYVNEIQIPSIYEKFKQKDIPVIGNPHGNQPLSQRNLTALHRSFDYVFLLGQKEKEFYSKFYNDESLLMAGIPSNDVVGKYNKTKSSILLIVNFRHDDPNYQKNVDYIHDWFDGTVDYSIVTDGDNDELIEKAAYVISAPSTFAFKSIQAGIPTALLSRTGETGLFYDYRGLTSIEEYQIKLRFQAQKEYQHIQSGFIEDTLEGGIDFTSTQKYVEQIQKII